MICVKPIEIATLFAVFVAPMMLLKEQSAMVMVAPFTDGVTKAGLFLMPSMTNAPVPVAGPNATPSIVKLSGMLVPLMKILRIPSTVPPEMRRSVVAFETVSSDATRPVVGVVNGAAKAHLSATHSP